MVTAGEERFPAGPVAAIREFAEIKCRCCEPYPKCIVTPHVAAFSADFEKNVWAFSVEKPREICRALG